ncbi:uncharacterized protein LOC103524116 [Trichonephila inaurata madagascariensis]|uniref:Uncharacterized protein LOC103524116 n=1 Tax=Trichonephila inaurata madagascariensis TaxID=2747483 RepID=A0A8X6M9P8_9ARAC|nr:uncharacterized protein LOC103524116 [Trichonephila inaurata madagascariensis]
MNQKRDRLLSDPFSDEEFQRALQKFGGKSAGPDGILPEFILEFGSPRFIPGAATSTSIAAMQLQTKTSGSSERRQDSALSLGERLLRREYFWPEYIPSQTSLKTQHTFLFQFQRLANVFGVSNNRLPIFKPTTFPGHSR